MRSPSRRTPPSTPDNASAMPPPWSTGPDAATPPARRARRRETVAKLRIARKLTALTPSAIMPRPMVVRSPESTSDPHVDHAPHDEVAGHDQAAEHAQPDLDEAGVENVRVVVRLGDVDEQEADDRRRGQDVGAHAAFGRGGADLQAHLVALAHGAGQRLQEAGEVAAGLLLQADRGGEKVDVLVAAAVGDPRHRLLQR